MYYVKVQGETLADLKAGLEAHLSELEGRSSTKVKVKTNLKVAETVEEVEEMEEVESPYANPNQPTATEVLNLRSTVIDNEVDTEGVPWDSRIHASSKAKVANGTFKIKRGVSDAEAFPIKAELRARVATSRPASALPTQAYPAIQQAPVQQPVYQAPVTQAPVVANPPMPQMQTTSGHTLDTFKSQFALVIGQLIGNGKLTQDYVNSLKSHYGIQEIWQASDAAKTEMFQTFVQYNIIQQVG